MAELEQRLQEGDKDQVGQVIFPEPLENPYAGEEIKRGRGYRYRGKHRSHTRGAGIQAFFRNSWMKKVGGR